MSPPRSSAPRKPGRYPRLCFAVLVTLAVLPGCTTADIDKIPTGIGGLPEGAPERPATAAAYPPVHDMPPVRAAPMLDEAQQKKLEADLIATRNRQSKTAPKDTSKPDKKSAEKPARKKAKKPAS